MTSQQAIATVLEQHPSITTAGYGLHGPQGLVDYYDYTNPHLHERFEAEHELLMDHTPAFWALCELFTDVEKSDKLHPVAGTDLQGCAMRILGREPLLGIILVAAIHCGFTFECDQHTQQLYTDLILENPGKGQNEQLCEVSVH